jgi:hypothetical protein
MDERERLVTMEELRKVVGLLLVWGEPSDDLAVEAERLAHDLALRLPVDTSPAAGWATSGSRPKAAPDPSESPAFAQLRAERARASLAPDGRSWRRKLFDDALRPPPTCD